MSVLVANLDQEASCQERQMEVVNSFLRSRQIPKDLQTRVRDYYRYLWKHQVSSLRFEGSGLVELRIFDCGVWGLGSSSGPMAAIETSKTLWKHQVRVLRFAGSGLWDSRVSLLAVLIWLSGSSRFLVRWIASLGCGRSNNEAGNGGSLVIIPNACKTITEPVTESVGRLSVLGFWIVEL